MTSPVLSLRRAITDVASTDAELRSLMGGSLRLFDEPPRGAEPVYALFGDVKAEDWSTDLDRGHVQNMDLVIWSEKGGARTALMAADRFFAILDDAPLPRRRRILEVDEIRRARAVAVEDGAQAPCGQERA